MARSKELGVCLLLIAAPLLVYAPVAGHPFVGLDDDVYVSANAWIQEGLTASGVARAFTTFHAANWHPLTWLSHMLDVELHGLRPGGHHVTSLVLHVLNGLLVFLGLRRMTGALWPSALVAGLFAVHPLHVESVAWIAERKDVLSTLLGLLTIGAYARSVDVPSWGRRSLVIATFALGLLAKPMLVTLPFVLLLLDFWPLERRLAWTELVREKLPLVALGAASSVVTFLAQRSGGAVQGIQNVPFSYRASNALVAYVLYPFSFLWPSRLAVYYPYPPAGRPWSEAAGALVLLALVTVLVVRARRSRPYLLVGWLFYLGTLVPVIGLVQVGGQSVADRYTYVPLLGLFVMIAWGAADVLRARADLAKPIAVAAVVWLVALAGVARAQVGAWRNSVTLFERTLAVTKDNAAIHYNLGQVLATGGRPAEAIPHFEEALRIWPDFYSARLNLGIALASQGKLAEAIEAYRRALRARPDSVEARVDLGSALARSGDLAAAEPILEEAVRLDPGNAQARVNLGLLLLGRARLSDATSQLTEAVRLDPRNAEGHNNLGLAFLVAGDNRRAAEEFSRALEIRPDYQTALANLQRAQAALK